MGWRYPSTMALSMSSAEATPSCTMRMASMPRQTPRRLVAKPGRSRTWMTRRRSHSEGGRLSRWPRRSISRSFMMKTGLKKVDHPGGVRGPSLIRAMLMELVLVP